MLKYKKQNYRKIPTWGFFFNIIIFNESQKVLYVSVSILIQGNVSKCIIKYTYCFFLYSYSTPAQIRRSIKLFDSLRMTLKKKKKKRKRLQMVAFAAFS